MLSYCFLPQEFLTEAYLLEQAQMLCQEAAMVSSLDVKSMLRHMDLENHTKMFDAGLRPIC